MINLVLALTCSLTLMENRTEFDWNDYDRAHLTTAKKRCGEIYKSSPCLKLFIKRTPSDYSAICGKEINDK